MLNRMKASHTKERYPVICFDESGREIRKYESLHEAAAEVGGYPTNISRACKSHKAYKNFYWKCLKQERG